MRTLKLALLLVILGAGSASAHPWLGRKIGIGVEFGDPTALNLGIRPNNWSQIDLAVGFGTFDTNEKDFDDGYVHLELVVKPFYFVHQDSLKFYPYLGFGGYFADHSNWKADAVDIGARFPIGLSFELHAPLEFFLELSIRVLLVSFEHDHNDRLDLGGAFGFRIWF
jgi:hypothetical protein